MNALEPLLVELFDGRLDEAGREKLNALIRDDAEARRVYLAYCQMHALLTASHGELHALRAPRRSPRPWLAAAAAVLIAATAGVIGWAIRSSSRLDASVLPAGGVAWIERGGERSEAAKGDGLRVGDRLLTGVGGLAELRYGDGTRLRIQDETELRVTPAPEGPRLELREGSISAQVAPQPASRPLVFSTPHGEASVVGPTFDLVASWNSTRLRTRSGLMTLRAGGREIRGAAGELGTADAKGLVRWTPVCDLDFATLRALPPQMDVVWCLSETLLTPGRTVTDAADKVHFVEDGFVLGPGPGVPYRHGLLAARWTEEVGDDVVVEVDVAGGKRWSLGISFSGDSFEGFRAIFAVPGNPEGTSLDTIHEREHRLFAHDPRPLDYSVPHQLRVESRGRRVRVWVDRVLRMDTEIDYALPAGRKKTWSISNFGTPPVLKGLRVWRAAEEGR